MSKRRAGTCGESGPRDAHCTEERGHAYSCYDAGEDVSWNDGQWDDPLFPLPPHQCDDSCTAGITAPAPAVSGQPEADR